MDNIFEQMISPFFRKQMFFAEKMEQLEKDKMKAENLAEDTEQKADLADISHDCKLNEKGFCDCSPPRD